MAMAISILCIVSCAFVVFFTLFGWETEPIPHTEFQSGNPNGYVEDSDIFSATETCPIHIKGNTFYGIRWSDRNTKNKTFHILKQLSKCLVVLSLLAMVVIGNPANIS
jgi:hypothetical protein